MKKRYILTFQPENINIPVTYNLIKKFDIKVNILNADLSSGKTGHLVMELESEKDELIAVLDYFEINKIQCHELKKQLDFKENLCVACGSCTAVCFSDALTLDKENWQLNFNHEKCVVCGLCVKACPLQLFNLEIDQYV
jgi:L-aspartate semialdehyde sulfurtransferase ferredoxin